MNHESIDDETDDDEVDTDDDDVTDGDTDDERTEIEIGEVIQQDIEEIQMDSIENESINDLPDSVDINYNSIEEFCPVVNSRDMEYELNNIRQNGRIKCKNHELCRYTVFAAPFKNNYLCDDCDTTYEKQLEIKDNIECPICLEIKRCVLQPRCSHVTCVDCFKLCYYSHEIIRPIFPYSMIKDEYNEDKKNPKWKDYPLIKIYRIELKNYIDKIKEKNKKKFLKKCPLCRK